MDVPSLLAGTNISARGPLKVLVVASQGIRIAARCSLKVTGRVDVPSLLAGTNISNFRY